MTRQDFDGRTSPNLPAGIDRRDFISGIATTVAAAGLYAMHGNAAAAQQPASAAAGAVPRQYYPPLLTGLRGQHDGSFEAAHAARDGQVGAEVSAEDTAERYDLVVVGAGISGLSAAHFFRKALGDDRRILILDNHDDFGGHAKRNEFRHNGRTYVGYGGTMSIETPFPYSYTSKALITELGIDVSSYSKLRQSHVYKGLGRGMFFDREHFGADRVVAGIGEKPWAEIFAAAPMPPDVRSDLLRIHTDIVDFLPALSPAEKVRLLRSISYQEYLLKHCNLLPASLPFFAGAGFRNNMRVDTCPAYTAARSGAVGFKGLNLPDDPRFHSDYEFHFPDGNASIARLLVDRLVPNAFPRPQSQDTIVTAPLDYDRLDVASQPTRIRLNSTVIRTEHIGEPPRAKEVRVVYVQNGKRYQVIGENVIMACFNNIIPHVVPSLPETQKRSLAYASKVPMQYTNVLVRNWEAWSKLGVSRIQAPNAYHTMVALDTPVSIGDYRCPTDPQEPIVLHMSRNPNSPGLPRKEQHRLGRAEMLATPFSRIESEIRNQLDRMLGSAGFRSKRDILAITVNRWPHGYAYTYDTLADPELPEAEQPHVLGRRAFGRIAIANADAGAAAFTNVAIDQAHRAVNDSLFSRGLI